MPLESALHGIRPAQIVINHWLKQYNHTRPHQALNTRPPVPETILWKRKISSPEAGG
ncbi:MAG: transposase [Dinoroseobacter sp.]|nr:transposase [Dinoroseobacter sp.]